jgi:hypothetical protein
VYYGVDTTGRDAEAAVKVLHVDWGDHQERRHVLERELRNDHRRRPWTCSPGARR